MESLSLLASKGAGGRGWSQFQTAKKQGLLYLFLFRGRVERGRFGTEGMLQTERGREGPALALLADIWL
jgi:hypothetical protein